MLAPGDGVPCSGAASMNQVCIAKQHQCFAVLRKHLCLHHRRDVPVPIEIRREVVVGANLAPIDRWICRYYSYAACGRKLLIEGAYERVQLLVKARCPAHLLDRRVSPNVLHFGKRNVLTGDVAIQDRLVSHVAAFNNYVVRRCREAWVTNQGQNQIIDVFLPMGRRHCDHFEGLESFQNGRDCRLGRRVLSASAKLAGRNASLSDLRNE